VEIYSGYAWFESQLGYQVSWLRVFMVFLMPSREVLR
jgi:hypothetical protein